MASGGFKRSIHAGHDLITVVTPHYRFVVRVKGKRARVVEFVRQPQLSDRSMELTAHEPDNTSRQSWLWRWFTPRMMKMCPTCGGGEELREVRVALPVMVNHRAGKCRSCEHRWWWLCLLCWCVLPFKQRIAGASCPAGKW